jgi:hypothetical protein
MIKSVYRAGLVAAASVAAFGFAAPASAALQLNSNGSVTVTGSSGGTVNINLGGNSERVDVPGLTSQLSLTFASAVNGLYTFDYTLRNTSSAPVTSSRITAFGFNADPNVVMRGASIVNIGAPLVFDEIRYNHNMPNGVSDVELCFTTNNCTGGGGDGLTIGQSSTGRFTLNFGSSNPALLTLDNFAVRYQSLVAPGAGGSGTGQVVTAVPEPGTWGLMLLGFGAVGVSIRRRRRANTLPQMA